MKKIIFSNRVLFQKLPILLSLISLCGFSQTTQKGADINGEVGDWSGYSVSMPDANNIAIGAIFNDGNGTDSGKVRIYVWNGTTWISKGITLNGQAAGDLFGRSVSMPDANTVAIGAISSDSNGSNSGQVRVYTWNGTTSIWTQKGAEINGEFTDDQSGESVSMPDANTVAIGAIFNDGNGADSGHVRIYVWNGVSWIQKGADIDGEAAGDWSGHSVSMPDADTVAIGADRNDVMGQDYGHTRIYTWNGTSWTQKGADIDGIANFDNTGHSVSMPDADTVAIGAPFNNDIANASGKVRIYTWDGTMWVQKGADINGNNLSDQYGWSVSMPDANTVAIGGPGSSSSSGQVRIFIWNGGAWIQTGADINGEAANDFSGWSVSMPDANTVAVGAILNDGNGADAGHVRVFNSPTLSQADLSIEGTALKLFPNPVSELLNIDLGDNQTPERLQIYDLNGRMVLQGDQGFNSVNVSGLAGGLYLIKIKTNEQTYHAKFIKQ